MEQEPDDDMLIARMKAGDAHAFSPLYRRYYALVYDYAYHEFNNREDAQDLAAEVFTAAVTDLARYRGPRTFRTWLMAIAHHMVADAWSLRYQQEERTTSLEQLPRTTPALIVQELLLGTPTPSGAEQRAQDLLAGLAPPARQVLELHFLRGLTLREVAVALGIPYGTARQRLSRAMHEAARASEQGPVAPEPPLPAPRPARQKPLPEHYRQILDLRLNQGLSTREIATAMHISIFYANGLLKRALRAAARAGGGNDGYS